MYIPKQEGLAKIDADLKQTFANQFSLNIGKIEIIKMKQNKIVTERDVKIAKFLFQFRFATAEQIHSFLDEKSTLENLRGRLEKLVHYRILNKFMLGDIEYDGIEPDAHEIYCLDLGGRYLLANFSNEDTTDWYSVVNMVGSEIVSKRLIVTQFYIQLQKTLGNRLVHFKPEPDFRSGKKTIIPSFDFSIRDGVLVRNYVGEVVREFDFPIDFREKSAKLEQLLSTNAWKKYYYDADEPPVLFVFAENDMNALEAAKMISHTTDITRVRLSTDERMMRELSEAGAFLRYNVENDVLQETRATVFKPQE